MTIMHEFEEVITFGDQFKTIVPIVSHPFPKLMAEEIISVQPMEIPYNEDFLSQHIEFEMIMRRTFGYDENAIEEFPDFFTEEEFNL